MRKEISRNLVMSLSTTDATAFTDPVPTGGVNGVSIDMTVVSWYSTATGTLTALVQESSDMQTWTDTGVSAVLTGAVANFPAYTGTSTSGASSTLSGRYSRVKYTAKVGSGTGQLCLSAGVSFFSFAT